MKTRRVCGCLLLLGTLLMVAGCKKAAVKALHNVGISNCAASPDTVTVHERDDVQWQSTDRDYTIRFSNGSEPTTNPFTIRHGASNPPRTMRGHSGCTMTGQGEFYCKYSLTRGDETAPCADPGIRIIP